MQLLLLVLLGIIQGLTEFIPISSTAHMTLFGQIAGLVDPAHPERWTATIAVVQLGTLFAVLAYFARDVGSITVVFLRETFRKRLPLRRQSLQARLAWLVIIGSVPIGVAGIGFQRIIESNLTKDPGLIAAMLAIVAVVMLIAERRAHERALENLHLTDALIIGCAQVLALLPGASRSGTTITTALLLGIQRTAAARYSFLLSIPALFASGVFELMHALKFFTPIQLMELAIATTVASISGYASIAFLLTYLNKRRMDLFAYYRLALAGIIVLFLWKGWLQ